jgi:transglutaminase-like putative cysteine protease
MQFTIRHETRCHFDSPASYSIRNLRLTPREEAGLRIQRWQVSTPVRSKTSVDAWGNTTHLLTLTEPHEEVRILVTGVIEVPDQTAPMLDNDSDGLAPLAFLGPTQLTASNAEILELAGRYLVGARDPLEKIFDCLAAINRSVKPAPRGGQPVRGAVAAMARGSGVLHDQVHVFIATCRAAGLPARFVSGYKLGRSATEHAWADIWLEEMGGWLSFDLPTQQLASGRLIRLAIGRDYLDACPMRTAHRGGGHEDVQVSVQAL